MRLGVISPFSIPNGSSAKANWRTFSITDSSPFTRSIAVRIALRNADWAFQWAKANDEKFDLPALQALPAFRSAMRTAIDRVNGELSVIEKVRQFTFADEPFAIDNGEMTPSLKIRRHAIRQRYGGRMDGLYKD